MFAATPISKLEHPHYLETYDQYMASYRDKEFVILEIGIAEGDSLYFWRDNFPKATIIGVDINPFQAEDDSGRIHTYQGKQQDLKLLDEIAARHAPDGFDVIVDDGSHIGHYTRQTFWHIMKNHIKTDGLYFIEDWGTGYWPQYQDGKYYKERKVGPTFLENTFESIGKIGFVQNNDFLRKVSSRLEFYSMKKNFSSHQNGMVGFVKELVDEAGIADATDERFGKGPQRKSMFKSMQISVGHVVIKRSEH